MKIKSTLFLCLFSLSCFAQQLDVVKMDQLFDTLEAHQKVMGSLSIFQNGQEVYQRSVGYENLAENKKATANSRYRIGSISKTFTSVIILQMAEEGKISLATKLSKYYPEIENSAQITIEMMLCHHSGIGNFTADPSYQQRSVQALNREELLDWIIKSGSSFTPGERMEYSNSNYVLLSLMAEKIDQSDFAVILDKRIIEPLGLEDTYYGEKIGAKDNESFSYRKMNDWILAPETDMSIPMGAGAVVSTPTDLNRFFNALFAEKVINKKSLKVMTNLVDNVGLGIFKVPFAGKDAYGHAGGIDGFKSNAQYFPKQGISIALTTNGMGWSMDELLISILSICFDQSYEIPDFGSSYVVQAELIDQYLGVYGSDTFPLKITISKQGDQLMAQATGQSAFPLNPYEEHKFRFDPAGLRMEFVPNEHKMLLIQGSTFELIKEK